MFRPTQEQIEDFNHATKIALSKEVYDNINVSLVDTDGVKAIDKVWESMKSVANTPELRALHHEVFMCILYEEVRLGLTFCTPKLSGTCFSNKHAKSIV